MSIDWYNQIIAEFGHGLCHQLPERSFSVLGVQYPVCARCTGIYVGFLFALATLLWVYRRRHPTGRPATAAYVVGLISVAAMAWDGVSSYASLRETSNLLRLVTGVGFGGSLALVTYAMLADVLLKNREGGPLLADRRALIVWVAACVGAAIAVYVVFPLLRLAGPAIVVVAVVGTFGAVGTALIGLSSRFAHSAESVRTAVIPATLGALVGIGGIITAKLLQYGLDRLAEALVL